MSSLKFNFQRAKQSDMEKLSPFFFKILENSKIRSNYPGAVFNSVWIMMQPESDQRATWAEILSDPEIEQSVKRFTSKFPGVIDDALNNKNISPLKPLIEIDSDFKKMNIALQEVYGSKLSKPAQDVSQVHNNKSK